MTGYDFKIRATGSQTHIEAQTPRAEEWMARWKGTAFDAGPTMTVAAEYAQKLRADTFPLLGLTVDDDLWAPVVCTALRKHDPFAHVPDADLRSLANALLQEVAEARMRHRERTAL